MFTRRSRYFGVPTVTVTDRDGREVQAVKLRALVAVDGDPYAVRDRDQLDVMSEALYGDAGRYWHVADASSELEANELTRVVGRVIALPKR